MKTYWRGVECPARRVLVRAVGYVEPRRAVEVIAPGRVLYLDDEDGAAWSVVTVGLGADDVFHLVMLTIHQLIDEPSSGQCPSRECKAKSCAMCASA